jgi:hypothetical protein
MIKINFMVMVNPQNSSPIKTYRYKIPIANLINPIWLSCGSFMLFIVVIYKGQGLPLWVSIFCGFMFLNVLLISIYMGYTSIKNIKPKQIVLEEDRITIPDLSAPSITFRYSRIVTLEIRNVYRVRLYVLSHWLSHNAIYVKMKGCRGVYICRAWMKNKQEFCELFEFIKEKVACYQADNSNEKMKLK